MILGEPALSTDLPEPPESRIRKLIRYSQREFPWYRFVPGRHPHPVRDPLGHSYQGKVKVHHQESWHLTGWRTVDDWCYGVDLFNQFYFWEAHEAWEGLWAVADRDGAPRLLLQGLIQVAAACLKAHLGVWKGTRSLSEEGLGKLRRAGDLQPHLLGLDIPVTVAEFDSYFARIASQPVLLLAPDLPILRLRD